MVASPKEAGRHRVKRKPNPVHPLISRLADPVYREKILAITKRLQLDKLLVEHNWAGEKKSFISLDYGASGYGIPFKNPNVEFDVERLLDCIEP